MCQYVSTKAESHGPAVTAGPVLLNPTHFIQQHKHDVSHGGSDSLWLSAGLLLDREASEEEGTCRKQHGPVSCLCL